MQVESILEKGIKAHRSGNLEAAQDAYLAILKDNPKDPDGLHFLGLLHFDAGKSENAIELIRLSLAENPDNAAAHNNLGNILKLTGDDDAALSAYLRAVELDLRHEEAWKNINVLLQGTADNDQLLPILEEIIRVDPENASAWHNYALSLLMQKRKDDAADALEKCLSFGVGVYSDPVWHARILCALGRRERAIVHLERIAAALPDNETAHYQLAAVRGDDVKHAPETYVKAHFDKFSDSFDEVLQRLGYRAPELVAAQVERQAAERGQGFEDTVDLGCGTGLCGPLIRMHCGKLTGIDLSQGMLRKAAALKVYDFLVEGELVSFLNADLPTQFDLAVCVDTLCYIGDLQPFMTALQTALKPGGLLIASVEHLQGASDLDYKVDSSGRYAHTPAYLRRCSENAGLVYIKEDQEVLRHELGAEVRGLVFTVRKPIAKFS
ncbi:tetratricopeptide repeat protein [Rhodobacterales bacterium]|nr:tetratricopeptide repeat protein [Rhodobacterales bacterium]